MRSARENPAAAQTDHQPAPRRPRHLGLSDPNIVPLTGPEHTDAVRALAALIPELAEQPETDAANPGCVSPVSETLPIDDASSAA